MKRIIKFIKDFFKPFGHEEHREIVEKLSKIFYNDIPNITHEQRRTISAVFMYVEIYNLGHRSSYYHPYPNMIDVINRKHDEIIKKYNLKHRGDIDHKHYYECFKKELIKYPNLEALYEEYYNDTLK